MVSTLQRVGRSSTSVVGDIGLFIVLIATIIAASLEVWSMIEARTVLLTDILMLFIYLEVMSMIDVYWRTGRLPVRMPLYIAMVAKARYIILEAGEQDVWYTIGLAAAILILALAVLVVRYGHLKLPYPETESRDRKSHSESEDAQNRRAVSAD